jgi:hypothetical protein
LNSQSLTKARYVSGLFVFPKDALRWSWQQRDFTPQIQMRRSSTPRARICRDWMRSNVRTASQRPQKIVSNKTGRKKIFSHFILALAESRGALLSLNGCDNVSGGLIHLSSQSSSLETFKINNTRSRQAA